MDEVCYFNAQAWGGISSHDAKADPQGKILNGRWVLANKGDLSSPDCKARYVACEINQVDDMSFFAATPPLEAKRLLMSQWAKELRRDGQRLQLHFSDAKNAYFSGKPHRSLYPRLPKELGLGPTVLGTMVRCCYGTRDAGAIWEAFYVDSIVSLGFKQCRASPCVFWHPVWKVSVVVHGDDLTALGTPTCLDKH